MTASFNNNSYSYSSVSDTLPEEVDTPTDVKLVEARTAVLLRNTNSHVTRNEPTMWILEHMFRPLTTRDYDEYQLLLLSGSIRPPWERKRKDINLRNQQSDSYFSQQVISTGTTTEGTPTPPVVSSQYLQDIPNQTQVDKMYIMTPRTRILTVTKEHSMVFMIDLSSSLATIETSTGRVMIGSAYNVLENIINGLVRPFSLNLSDSSAPIVMEPIIRITVVAECSQFGSNMNVIPILAEYPTMRVLMQNVLVSVNNVSTVLKTLYDLIYTFKQDLGKFRKKLTIKRSKMGYELDVRGDHAQTVEESAESNFTAALESPTKPNLSQLRKNSIPSFKGDPKSKSSTTTHTHRHTRNKSITSKNQLKKSDNTSSTPTATKKANHHHHHRHSSASTAGALPTTEPVRRSTVKDKKDVWGVGKTGSTLPYILRAGLFALNLSSKEGQPSIVLITDGVVKSNIQDESVIRQLTTENIACSVVQVGPDRSFFPGLNFGFVPDNEVLEFVTNATNGNFMYAENCPSITPNSNTTNGDNADNESSLFLDPPNIYHHRLLLKEIHLDKVNSSRQSRKNKDNNNGNGSHQGKSGEMGNESNSATVVDMSSSGLKNHHDHRIFPWDPISQPIAEDIGICKYKEYFLPAECWHFMRARLRQGFLLYSVALIDETKSNGIKTTTTNGVKYVGQTVDEDNLSNNFQKKESVVIVFTLCWQPNITVEYRIKSLWTSSLRHYLKTISLNQERLVNIPEEPHILENDNIFTCMRAPRAQIIIKSTATFTHMLSNWDQFQRRNQMMAVQGAKSSIDLTGAPGFIKVGKLKRLLERLAETDAMLKQLVQFNLPDKVSTINPTTTINEVISKGGISQLNMSRAQGSTDWSTKLNYIQKFSSYWAKLERSELRVFNMCWYDEQFFNLIIGSSLTHLNIKNYRLDGANTISAEYDRVQFALNHIYTKLENWSTFMSEDQQVYIKILNVDETANKSKSIPRDKRLSFNAPTTSKKQIVPQFCELRAVRETDKLLCIKLMFFNVNINQRHSITEELQALLADISEQIYQNQTLVSLEIKSPSSNSIGVEEQPKFLTSITRTKRPLSSLLMRDEAHFLPTATEFENGKLFSAPQSPGNYNVLSSKSMWFINPALVLSGEFIVKNYLLQYTWHWDVRDIPNDKVSHGRYFTPLLNLAFEHIAIARLEKKWSLISFSKSFAHFYKEIEIENSNSVYSVQYFIWKDFQLKRISTELWLEPLSDEHSFKFHDRVKNGVHERDRQILSQLITFDIMYGFGQNSSEFVTNVLSNQMEIEDETRGSVKWMQRLHLFNLSAALRFGSFLFALYPCPNYNRHFHPEGNDSVVLDQQQQQASTPAVSNLTPASTINNVPDTPDPVSYVRRRNAPSAMSAGMASTASRSRTVSKFSPAGSPLVSRTPLLWHSDTKGNTTCTCPRPDELICTEKDDISKLRPVFRDIALLHYYIENSLFAVTDRSMSLKKTPVDEFGSFIIRELLQSVETGASRSTLYAAQNFRDLRCFIKIFDPSVFVVILIPRLDAIVRGLCNMDLGNVISKEDTFDRMGLMMFECHRQDSNNSYGTALKFDQIKIQPIDPLSSKEWLESLRSTLRPELSRGSFSTNTINEPLSDRTLRLMQDVSQVYSRSFVKSIFTCLLHGRAIDSEDFEKVLEICDESNLDIDLTGYLNVQTLLKRRSRTSEEELVSANQRFISVLNHYFEPVIISNTKWTNMYCYRPPFAKVGQKLGRSLSSGEKPSNLADVVVCAQNPLFVRLECTLRKPAENGVGFTETTFPLKSLPVSYEGESEDGNTYNFEPESIGTKLSPVNSADGTTATLHLVCMTLPQSEYDPPNALFSHRPACPADSTVPHQASFLDADKTHRARLPSLSQDKQDALVETEARLTWLFTEEIMHGLLRSGPITQNVIRYIEAQLKKKNPFVDFPTTMFIPLAFVKSQKESRRMFFEELEKHSNSPYRLVRVGDCFYASDNGTNNTLVLQQDLLEKEEEDDGSLFDGEGLNITTDNSSRKKNGTGEQGSDEFCEGLGISILEPETPDEEEVDMVKQEPLRPQLYWLLLIPQAQNVQIYFYSKMQQSVNRSEIIRVTKSMVNEVMERTNKMSLLQHLHDTRRCSKYLLSPSEDEKPVISSGDESSDEDDNYMIGGSGNNLVEILSTSGEEAAFAPPKKFIPGQFSCDIVYTKRFPLHWRLQPNSALNKLMTDTLPPFLVKNKPGMFVISHNDAVVYCFLTEVTTMVHSSTLSDSMTHSFLSANNNEADEYYVSHPDSPYGSSLTNLNENNEVFGTSTHSRIRHTTQMYNKPSPQGSITSERQQFSPRDSPSFTDAGVPATSPIAGKRPSGRQYEGRELVLEVYGVESDDYIVDGLVEMIDSRITSEITLKEVQQFLIRNPNSKLSRADIDFILPVEKEPLIRKQLSIPSLVENTVQFLKIFRKNTLAGSSLHAIQSNYLPAVIKKQHDLRYSSYGNSDLNSRLLGENNSKTSSAEEWSCLDLSFYYNYLNRAPGMYLPFEQKIGEGVAGMCLSIINEDDLAYSKISSNHAVSSNKNDDWKFSVNDLKSCLGYDFEQADSDDKLRICIDIWSHCKIDVEQIYLYLYKSFRQSICDYIIENAVSFIPRQLLSETNATHQDEFKAVANLLIFALQKASEWESSTVKQISRSINLTPWYFDGLVQQLKLDLIDVHPSLEPTVSRAKLSSKLFASRKSDKFAPVNYKLYTPGVDHDDENDNKSGPELSISTKRIISATNLSKKISFDKMPLISKKKSDEKKKHPAETPVFNHENYKYLVISGLPELFNKYGSSSSSVRRCSADMPDNASKISTRVVFGNSVNSIVEEESSFYYKNSDVLKRDDTGSLHSRQESLASSVSKGFPHFLSKQKNSDYKEISHQHSFIIFSIDSSELSVYAYNCSETFTEHIYNATYKNVVQQETRHMALGNILHQKLGLFHHTDPMSRVLCHNNDISHVSVTPSTAPQFPSTPLPHGAPLQHNALVQVQNSNNGRSSMSPSVANTIGRLVQTDSSSSILTLDSAGPDRRKASAPNLASNNAINKKCPVDLEILRHLVTNTFDYTSRIKTGGSLNLQRFMSNETNNSFQQHPVFDTADNAKLCRPYKSNADSVYTAARGANANTLLRDGYAESIEENKTGYEKDYLLRHGEPYLEMYLARSKPLAAHEKAFKVYTKWADQYYGPGHSKTTDEMMTVDELKQILKASRLLHFCRTPLIFSESTTFFSDITTTNTVGGYEKLFKKTTVSKSEEMTAWYERLARGFMREYASYLESIGMHLIVHGPSNNQQDEVEAYLSRFTITENYSVDSPVVYLLQVFEGGSIMCEARLTGAFVSVTLYTLHRRYGRLQHSPYIQRRKEVGRANFQSFMGECDLFKQRIHVNSFVFDFHLRYIQRSLDDVDLLPINLNLLSIIKNTVSVYDRPAIYSRNRIINGIYEFPVEDSLSTLSSWILRSGGKLNLETLNVDKVPVACFVSSDDLSFENRKRSEEGNENSPFRYTLILCPAEKTSNGRWRDSISVHRQGSFDMMGSNPTQKLVSRIVAAGNGDEFSRKISLQYFILVTFRGMDRCTSSDRCQRAWSEVLKEKPQRYANFLDEVLVPETFKMNDVFESAKLKIDEVINKAIQLFHRESDWNKLYEIVRPNLTKELPEDLIQLTSRFNPIHLGIADPSFNKFLQLKGLNWNDALDNLKLFYKMTSGEIHIRDTRHVLLFIPNTVSPTFFHFVYTPGEKCVVTINTKDRKDGQSLWEDEKIYISNLATNLSYYIWKRVHYS